MGHTNPRFGIIDLIKKKKAGIILHMLCRVVIKQHKYWQAINCYISSTPLHSKSLFLSLLHAHTNTHLPCAMFTSGRGEVVTTCTAIITGADGDGLLHAVSNVLSLIGQKLHVSRWPVQTIEPSWSWRFYNWLVISDHWGSNGRWMAYCHR